MGPVDPTDPSADDATDDSTATGEQDGLPKGI
jgi:hypothetical protein